MRLAFQLRSTFQWFVVVLFTALPLLATSADKDEPGAIEGTVNYCEQGGLDGMQVYVPGQMFVVITAEDGRFKLSGLPAGKYILHYRAGQRRLNQNRDIEVFAGQTTNLSVITFCDQKRVKSGTKISPAVLPAADRSATKAQTQNPCETDSEDPQCKDADGDGTVAALDCDDANAGIHPGAVELCDGVDNNCSGVADDGVSANAPQAMAACRNGQLFIKSCLKSYSDCDGIAANGCEVDIMNDDENCGSCGNECSTLEMCGRGFC